MAQIPIPRLREQLPRYLLIQAKQACDKPGHFNHQEPGQKVIQEFGGFQRSVTIGCKKVEILCTDAWKLQNRDAFIMVGMGEPHVME